MQAHCSEPQRDPALVLQDELDAVLNGSRAIDFHFQPIVDLQSAATVGYEALVRFGGRLNWSPDRWFQAAAHLGRRAALEALVLEQSLRTADLLPENTFLSVNVGPDFLLSEEWDRLVEPRPSLSRIVVEITEQDVIHDYRRVQQKIAGIRARGGSVATDDVGAGYASLKHVMEIRPDFVKLDRGFVEGCHRDPARAAMIEMLGTIAGRLDAWIIAEGIENKAELEELIRLEVPLAQGFYLGRPDPKMSHVTADSRRDILAMCPAAGQDTGLRRVLESCAVFENLEVGLHAASADPQAQFTIVVDAHSRPHFLIERHPLLGLRTISGLMKVQMDSTLPEVMHRALARPLASRFDPVAAINERGEFLGLLGVDRLMTELLHKPSSVMPTRSHVLPAPFLLRP